MLENEFVLSPDRTVVPSYRISPFRTEDISRNRAVPVSAEADYYFRERFPGKRFVYCESGRQALGLALHALKLAPEHVVTILTTTGNLYISGCVTREIEKVCRWSRQMEAGTKALLVNHEFGFAYEELRKLREHGLPIIEDAAHAFASNNSEESVSNVGQFTVYSFPKFFPVQFGGLLVCESRSEIEEPISGPAKRYLQKVLWAQIAALPQTRAKRQENYRALGERVSKFDCSPRFALKPHSVPGVFMFRTPADVDLPGLKTFMQARGIECSVFYGEQAFFIPVHERLTTSDLDFLAEVYKSFVKSCCHRQTKTV